jgi:hypothetical protein
MASEEEEVVELPQDWVALHLMDYLQSVMAMVLMHQDPALEGEHRAMIVQVV